MSGVYIGYRRGGPSMWAAERLADRLRHRLPSYVEITAVDRLASGAELPAAVRATMARCQVLVAVIGEDWLEAPSFLDGVSGVRRMDDVDDPVRIEISSAVTLGLDLLPVLVDSVPMPASAEVPEEVRPLLRRHSLQLSPARFEGDADELVDRLRVILGIADRERSTRRRRIAIGSVLGALLIAAAAVGLTRERLPEGIVRSVDLDLDAADIAVGPDGRVWVADDLGDAVVVFDPDDPDDKARVEVGSRPMALAPGGDAMWVANGSDGTVTRIDTESLEVVATYDVGFEPQSTRPFFDPELSLVANEEAAWLVAGGVRGIRRLDMVTGEQATLPAPTNDDPTALALSGDTLWVTDSDQDGIYRVDPDDGDVLETLEMRRELGRMVATTDAVWVESANDTLTRVDTTTGSSATVSTRLSSEVDDMAPSGDGVWVTGGDDTAIHIRPSLGTGFDYRRAALPEGHRRPNEEARAFVAAGVGDTAWAVTSGGLVVEVQGVE